MGMKSKIINLSDGTKAYLRLTLGGQKQMAKLDPDSSVIANILSAIDDPEAMETLLTACLNFVGNKNTVTSGEELYNLLVDEGYQGVEKWGGLILDLCHGSGLVKQEDSERIQRIIARAAREQSESLDSAADYPTPAREAGADPLSLPTLDG